MNLSRRTFLSMSAAAALAPAALPRTPNVVLIYCDDLGYGDLGCYGSSIPTPNIDSLAKEGTRFTTCISANPVCSPSRAALLTGRYPTRVGVPRVLFPEDKSGLDLGETTLANILKARSYRTKAVGKWHLGVTPHYLPTERGFDEYFGIPYSNDMNPPSLMRNKEVIAREADQTQLTPEYTREATEFIRQSGQNPFFLYLAHTYPHIPLHASPRFRGKSEQGLYGDVLQELDWSTGEILKTLQDTGVARDTLVIFSSDNGPWYLGSPGRLRGRKGSTYEGGVREPLLMRYPGQVPAGHVSNALISMMDFFPTIASLTGARLPDRPLDGVNAWPVFSGAADKVDRDILLYFDYWNLQAARHGRWKIHVARHNSDTYQPPPAEGRLNLKLPNPELYDMELDPDESYDVADKHPEVVRDLVARIDAKLTGFPEEVQKAWAETQARPSFHYTPGTRPQTKDPRAPALPVRPNRD
jgi:arylsulfatase